MNDRSIKMMKWFAVGADGNSVVRVAPGLALGESDTGALTLNDADSGRRWVAFEEHAGGTWLEASDRAAMAGEDGMPLPGAFLKHGMVLHLPNNELYISRDIGLPEQAGPVLAVTPVHTAERQKAGAPEVDEDREAAPEVRIPRRGSEVLAAAPQPAISPSRDRRRPTRRRRGWRGRALAVTMAVLAVGIAALPMLAPDVAYRLRQAVADSGLLATMTAGRPPTVPADDLVAVIPEIPPPPVTRRQPVEPDRARPADAGGETGDMPTERHVPPRIDVDTGPTGSQVPARTADGEPSRDTTAAVASEPAADVADDAQDSANPAVEARLARARDLLYEGNVTYPPGDNAVDLLADVLATEPNHPGARLLLEECSQRLTQTAQRLHENGLHYEARNTLEEVLSFDPDSARARSLLRRWVGSRS